MGITRSRSDPVARHRAESQTLHAVSERHAGVRALVAACALAAVSAHAAPPDRPPVAIIAVTVVDLERDRSPRPRTVLIDYGRIVAVTDPRTAQIPANSLRVDGRAGS